MLEAIESHVPLLTSIHVAAFRSDNAVRLMFPSISEHDRAVVHMIASQLPDPKFMIAMATSRHTGDGLGWIGCSLFGFDNIEDKEIVRNKGAVKAPSDRKGKRDEDEGYEYAQRSSAMNTPSKFASFVHDNAGRMQSKHMSKKKYIYINTLATDPAYQGRGVGTAMVRWIVAKADAENVLCWVQSSPTAVGVYLAQGFEEVEHLDVDLTDFAPGGREGKRGWGVYGFRYMLRHPRPTSGQTIE